MHILWWVDRALWLLSWLIFIDVILTWIPSVSMYHPAVVLLRKVTSPVLDIFRKILPPQRVGRGYMDFSPILAMVTILIIRAII